MNKQLALNRYRHSQAKGLMAGNQSQQRNHCQRGLDNMQDGIEGQVNNWATIANYDN